MKFTIVAPVGDNLEALFLSIKEFPVAKVILICPRERLEEAAKAKKDLERLHIEVRIKEIKEDIMEEIFAAVAEIKHSEGDANIIVNVATGDRMSTCAALSAAFVNGLKAIGVMGNEIMMLPVLKFSYYKLLTEKKMDILKILYGKNSVSLDELNKKTKMSLPLLSYHINGNLRSEGLRQMGLIETAEKNRSVYISITMIGRLLVKGYV